MNIEEMTKTLKPVSPKWDVKSVESKWQKKWEKDNSFAAVDFSDKPKFYVLSEFFGPSGKGIHLGHVKCFTPTEIIARFMRLKGYNVLYPVGWDAFGLPTENYALKTKTPPDAVTANNVGIFTNQLKKMGFSFDWSREITTSSPDYYKWTQWIFLQLFKNGMAYKTEGEVNFCPVCETVLSNEDSQGGECDRCHNPVIKAKRNVWYLRMKDYSEKMLEAVEAIDMKDSLKESQRNWIGKSTGAEIDFSLSGNKEKIKVFTTRPDTLFGATFMVVSPEHAIIDKMADKIKNIDAVREYQNQARQKTDIERTANKSKTGVKLEGVSALNPVTKKEIPVFIADYVLVSYGTGAIMAVPAHDERDYDFAKKFGVPIVEVISGGDITKEAYTGDGALVNSGFLNGLHVEDAKKRITAELEKMGAGVAKVNYKMQDWPFNRQRYWGEPFPVIVCDKCGYKAIDEGELPLKLPATSDFKPDASGNGPLSKVKEFVECKCPSCGGKAKRETDTMPNWAGSSWYWLRFLDPHNDKEFVSQEKLKYWGAVDLYTGGVEHVTRHMLYASFWHNFLYDMKKVPHKLPFKRRMCNGLILDDKGKKMGKSSGNAIDPILIIDKYGADVFRLHVMFMGEYEQNTIWSFDGITGIIGFLNKVWDIQEIVTNERTVSQKHEVSLHNLIKKADNGIYDVNGDGKLEHNDFKFNTIIAAMMEFVNEIKKDNYITAEEYRQFLIILNSFAPYITSEIFEIQFKENILNQKFPEYDEKKLTMSQLEIPVQLLGKLKGTISIIKDEAKESVEAKAVALLQLPAAPKKIIYVPNKIVNIII